MAPVTANIRPVTITAAKRAQQKGVAEKPAKTEE